MKNTPAPLRLLSFAIFAALATPADDGTLPDSV
jgi:hypothetical protein